MYPRNFRYNRSRKSPCNNMDQRYEDRNRPCSDSYNSPEMRSDFSYDDRRYTSYREKQPCDIRDDYYDNRHRSKSMDAGPCPFVINIEEATKKNNTFRTAIWTGEHLQLTLMSIMPCEDIGLEMHPHVDQFLRLEAGEGLVLMGECKDRLDFQRKVCADDAFVVPAGTWHNLINTGECPIKLYSIYAPPQHPHGTVHCTKEDAMAGEEKCDY